MTQKLLSIRIFLPLKDNDGVKFPPAVLKATYDEILQQFGAYSLFEKVKGVWSYGGITYVDKVNVVETIVYSTPATRAWLAQYKEILKNRFRQIEIFITVQETETL